MEIEAVHLRARSNSAESWEAVNGSRGNIRHTWQTEQEEEKDIRNDNNNGDSKNQSYAQSTRSQLG